MTQPTLYIVIPCYNEEDVLPVTLPQFVAKLEALSCEGRISRSSRVLFVDDGSADRTWELISRAASQTGWCKGIRLSRNRGHQNALLAGLMEAKDQCDITISIDCDGQDDINAMDEMIKAYSEGCEIVYGVRSSRAKDSFWKRVSAQQYYKLLRRMGVDLVYDHADYRLVSARALDVFQDYHEVNLFLRGMFPLVGFHSTCVYYERKERLAGKSKYSLGKMLKLAFDGITSLSTAPIRWITIFGLLVSFLSFIGIIWAVVTAFLGKTVAGWASTACIVCFIGGIQCLFLGVIGEYVGKIYLEVKARPRYTISERTN